MDIKFIDINKSLKENLSKLYNIIGEDVFLIKNALLNIKSFCIKDLEEFNYAKIDCSKMKKAELESILATLPIGNEYRLVVAENLNADCIKYINSCDLFDGNVILVCINADKIKNATTIDCTKLDKKDITIYITSTLNKNKLQIEDQAIDYIIDATNSNMSTIVSELNKIIAYCKDVGKVSMQDVVNLVAGSNMYVIYMLTAAIDEKDFSKYQSIIVDMAKSQTYNEIFSYMGKYFRRMQYISINKNDAELSSILGIKPYAIQMSRKAIAKNGIKYYVNLYTKYVDLDYQIKSGKISAKNALYELVF